MGMIQNSAGPAQAAELAQAQHDGFFPLLGDLERKQDVDAEQQDGDYADSGQQVGGSQVAQRRGDQDVRRDQDDQYSYGNAAETHCIGGINRFGSAVFQHQGLSFCLVNTFSISLAISSGVKPNCRASWTNCVLISCNPWLSRCWVTSGLGVSQT